MLCMLIRTDSMSFIRGSIFFFTYHKVLREVKFLRRLPNNKIIVRNKHTTVYSIKAE